MNHAYLLTAFGFQAEKKGGARLRVLRGGKVVETWDLPHPHEVRDVAFSRDGKTILTGCIDKQARLWSWSDHSQQPRLHATMKVSAEVLSSEFSPDQEGRTLLLACGGGLTGDEGKYAVLFDAHKTDTELGTLKHERGVACATFSADGKRLATGSEDTTARIWDAGTLKAIGKPLIHTAPVWRVAFSRDRRWLATGTSDGKVTVWDVATQEPLGPPYRPLNQKIRDVSFVPPDERAIAFGIAAGTAGFIPVPEQERGPAGQVMLRMQVLTGLEPIDNHMRVHVLDAVTYAKRRDQLNEMAKPQKK